jgi:hypothetical protein
VDALILAAINLSHIFFSYEGFRNLDSGVSFAIFNTYPLMILLIAGVMWNNVYLLVLLGLVLFILGESAATDKERSSTGPEGTKAAPFGSKEEGSKERSSLHLCTIKTPTLSAVMSEQGVADCAFQMHNQHDLAHLYLPINWVF